MTNAERILKRLKGEQPELIAYATNFLEEEPDIDLPTLRDLHKHNASVTEYRAHREKIKRWGTPL